ncbi:MAG: hypothetical protein L3K09_02505 [Thermoplasmata archaeon]|nr:hypothetical protein [Thermoplasmata archaeon]
MPEHSSKMPGDAAKNPTDRAISQIVQMNPRRVTVTLTLPVPNSEGKASMTLEWGREDTNQPLSELLKRIESYMLEFGGV